MRENPAGTRVITSVHEMGNYLTNTYGAANITWGSGSVSSNVGNSRGIMMYRNPSGGAGANHVVGWSSGSNTALDGWFQSSPKGTTSSFWEF